MDLIFSLVALILISALAGYFLMLGLDHFRASAAARESARLERVYLRARIKQVMAERHFEKEKNELSWNGYRKFEIVRKVSEAKDISSFYLAPHDGKPLPPYLPGQYLTFQLNVPEPLQGVQRRSPGSVIRCYSLSDSPTHRDYYRVTIKKIGPPRDHPDLGGGAASTFFHDYLKEGDIVDVKAPAGQFTLDMTKRTSVVFIAGGIGVTPLLSMANSIVETHSKRETWFFYGVRNSSEHVMKEHLQRLALENENVNLRVCYSEPLPNDVRGRDYDFGEHASVSLFRRLLPSSNYEFYICGPPPMMSQITSDLKAWGVPEKNILFEAFGPATVKKITPVEAKAAAAEAAALQVSFAVSGKTCRWKPETGSLLELAEANGVSIDFGCRAGNCGTCLTAVKSGEVQYLVEHGAKPEEGSCLTCISIPKSDLVLNA